LEPPGVFTVDNPLSKRYVNKESGWTINLAITLNLRPEVEAGLIAQAQANGMTLEEYLLSMGASPRTISSEEDKQTSTRGAAVQRMLEFGEKYHLSLGEPVTRTLLHQEHRF
jgi:hypothetical protein